MANPEHLAILKQGAAVWNQWRQENWPDLMRPDLRGATLNRMDLRKVKLTQQILGRERSRERLLKKNASVVKLFCSPSGSMTR